MSHPAAFVAPFITETTLIIAGNTGERNEMTMPGQGFTMIAPVRRFVPMIVVCCVMALSLCVPARVSAATRHVVVGGSNSGDCISVACGAIAYAIAQAGTGDNISVAAGTYNEHNLLVSTDLTITGAGAATTILDAGGAGRGMTISAGTVTISGLTIQNGAAPSQNGGGITNAGRLTLINAVVRNNAVSLLYDASTGAAYGFGGGIYSAAGSSLTLIGTTVSGNTAGNRTTAAGSGGGIYTRGPLVVQGNSVISGNTAACGFASNATACYTGGPDGGYGNGGGIMNAGQNATVAVTNSTMSGNTAYNQGGAIKGAEATNQGGALTLDHAVIASNVTSRAAVDLEAPLTMTGSSITGTTGIPDGQYGLIGGGALTDYNNYTVSISDSVISGNAMKYQGVVSLNVGAVTIARTTLADNTNDAVDGNGALDISGYSGGSTATITDSQIVRNRGSLTGGLTIGGNNVEVTITNTTIANNTATASQSGAYAFAGGILDLGGVNTILTNSTVSGNTAPHCTQGSSCAAAGGVATQAGGMTITNSTISGNTGGGFSTNANASSTLTNVTVAANDTGVSAINGTFASPALVLRNTLVANTGANCAGFIGSGGYNLSSDATCGFAAGADQSSVNPKLSPLANNGGPTLTHALQPGSPAIDVIPATGGCNGAGVTIDQRGVGRPSGAGCEIGAVEFTVNTQPGTHPTAPLTGGESVKPVLHPAAPTTGVPGTQPHPRVQPNVPQPALSTPGATAGPAPQPARR